jgi:hypothetical protein
MGWEVLCLAEDSTRCEISALIWIIGVGRTYL